MFKWICAFAGLLAILATPALGAVSNGFDSDLIYALWGGANTPLDVLLTHSKLTVVSTDDNWVEVGEPTNTAASGTFWGHQFISLTFSCSPTAGANTLAGYRLFYLGRERSPDFDTYRPILVEVDSGSPPQKLREAYIGNIVCGNKSFCGASNVQNWPNVNLRYNTKNNTLMVGISHNGAGTGGILHGYIYEFTLPDSPVGTGLGSPDELLGITLMETYDTGFIGDLDASGGVNINVAPDGTVYSRQPVGTTNVYSFSTAGGATLDGTNVTSNPTLVVTGAALTTAAGNGIYNWQSAIYRPVSNSLVNLQRKTGGSGNAPVVVDYDLDTGTASVIAGSTWYRGQHNGVLDAATGDIWIASQNLPSLGGGARKYTHDTPPVLAPWDSLGADDGGRQLFDIAVPPGSPGACCKPAGAGCEVLSLEACTALAGAWQGPASICGESSCPAGACCGGCGKCEELPQADCTGGRVWSHKECSQVTCDPAVCGTPAADANCDGDVDQTDFALLQACLGSDPTTEPACECLDLAPDLIIDADDLLAFELCASGPGIPLNPACAD
jgi:hypothetical protein